MLSGILLADVIGILRLYKQDAFYNLFFLS
jgi:hypothetical protein